MTWKDQNPPANDVLAALEIRVPGELLACIEIDKLPENLSEFVGRPRYRATIGTLFEDVELVRTAELEELLRRCNMARYPENMKDAHERLDAIRELK